MRHIAPAFCLTSLVLTGCDADCGDPARIDGLYTVQSNVVSEDWVVTGYAEDDFEDRTNLLYGIFANGSSTWRVRSQPSAGGYQFVIDGQQFDAQATPSAENCNVLDVQMQGAWSNPENGAVHQFDWQGELVWTGDELGGSFSYEDEWGLDDTNGTISIPRGEIRATLSGGDDTGR